MSKLRKLSFIIVIGLMCFFVFKSFTSGNEVAASETTIKTNSSVKITNGNNKAGNIYLDIYDSKGNMQKHLDQDENNQINVPSILIGYKITVGITLNEGYSIRNWASTNEVTYTPVKDSSGEIYTSQTLNQTIKTNDLSIYVLATNANEHVITVYETSSTEMSSIIGYVVVENGKKADMSGINLPTRKGFNFDGYNEDTSNVTSDMIVHPTFKSNIWTIFRDYWPLFLKGLGITLLLAIFAIALSLILGAGLCLLKISKNKVLSVIASAYIEIIRGVPSLLLLLLIYCLVGPTKIHIGSFFSTEVLSCILALFLNSSAYTAEIFRSGIQAVDGGQMEAGRALGMSNWQVLKKVVLPQGLKNALPSLGNELVMIIKETSLAYSVNNAIGELMCAKVTITSVTGNSLAPYIIIAIIYFIVTFSLSRLIMYLEKRYSN